MIPQPLSKEQNQWNTERTQVSLNLPMTQNEVKRWIAPHNDHLGMKNKNRKNLQVEKLAEQGKFGIQY